MTPPPPINWEDGTLEDLLSASIKLKAARSGFHASPPPRNSEAESLNVRPIDHQEERKHSSASETLAHCSLEQLIVGCGIAAIDGYLKMREYAKSKGLDLVELHHKGIDLQDIISTLVIFQQRMSESESPARRFRR